MSYDPHDARRREAPSDRREPPLARSGFRRSDGGDARHDRDHRAPRPPGDGEGRPARARSRRRRPAIHGRPRAELTVVTNSLLVAQALMASPRVEVILTGGTLRRSIHALVGPAAEESVRALRASKAFMSGNGFTAERGLSTPSPLVAATDRAFASAAQQVVGLAAHTTIGPGPVCRTW